MQAHLYPTRKIIRFLLLLTVGSLPVIGIGCSSSDPTEYREFSDKIDKSGQETVTSTADINSDQSVVRLDQQPETATTAQPITEKSPSSAAATASTTSKSASKTRLTENKTVDDVVALIARKPDPKLRALTAEEKKTLTVSEPREVKILIKDHSFRKTSPGNSLRVSYDDIDLLKVMNMEPVTPNALELMPQWLKDLDGKRIRIRGFMYPPFQQTGNEYFQLARDNQICCFGKNPKIYDLFPVVMREGVTADYILNRPFDVVGVFHIKAETLDDELQRIYLIDDAVVIDK
ncbi:MAG: hypothetical protein QM501_03910 [Gimesia sp.]